LSERKKKRATHRTKLDNIYREICGLSFPLRKCGGGSKGGERGGGWGIVGKAGTANCGKGL